MISISDGNQTVNLDDAEAKIFDEINIEVPVKREAPKARPARPSPFARQRPQSSMPPAIDEGLEMFVNPGKRTAPAMPPPEEYDGAEDSEEDVEDGEQGGYEPQAPAQPSEGYKTIEDEKADLLNKITRLVQKGFKSNAKLTIYSDIDEIRTEYKRITYGIEVERSIKFQRRMLIAAVTGLEFLNEKFDPFDIELNGWSQNTMENIDDYDGVFEELYNKYKTKVAMAPEIKLLFMVGGSAMMFHLSNSMVKSVLPKMQQNPAFMQSMNDAMQNMYKMPSAGEPPAPGLKREMRGPGVDFGSLMSMMGPPPPANTRPVVRDDESVSDIVSIDATSDTREVPIGPEKKKRGRKPKGKEVTI
jgi:hypothetical protein